MDAADVESAEVIEVGNTGRVDHFNSCGQRRPKWNGEVPEMMYPLRINVKNPGRVETRTVNVGNRGKPR